MKISEIAALLEARVLTASGGSATLAGFCAGERISDLLNGAADDGLIVTTLSNEQLLKAMQLLDAPALCLVGGVAPEAAVVAGARRRGIALMVSPYGFHEVRDRLRRRLGAPCESGP